MSSASAFSPEKFSSFGELLRFLRRKAELTQRELAIAVGYSESQISRLEKNERAPDEATLAARFVPALYLEDEPQWVARLLELGSATHIHAPEGDAPKPIAEPKSTPHNLPAQLTSFIGREKEMSEISRLISGGDDNLRLLTLTGHGGCGKTRLALQTASGLLETFPDGIWLVELAPISDPLLMSQTVASVLGLKEEPGRPLLSTLTDHLRHKKMLFILDNCEHLAQASAQIVEGLLLACPNLSVLATSREMLGVAGEHAMFVPSLALPDPRHHPLLEELSQYEAVRLFVDRASNALPGFALTLDNAPAVVQICQRLDGIPLALELAANRVKVLSVDQIAARLADMFRLLTGGNRTALPRHQTLQATVDWSFELLTEAEGQFFTRLSVFAGGWTLEAAELVCAGESVWQSDVLDLLTQLVNKSLVIAKHAQGGEVRYHLLETIRQYALTKLAESGEADVIRKRHAEYFLAFAEKGAPHLFGIHPDPSWYDRMETEHDNLRAILSWCQSVSEGAETGFRLTNILISFWYYRGYWSESDSWLEGALAHPQAESYPREQALARLSLGTNLSVRGGNYEVGYAYITHSLKVFRELNDRPNIAWSLHWLGHDAREQGDAVTARAQLEECVQIFRELEDDSIIAVMTNTLAEAIILQGEVGLAKSMLEENLALARKVRDTDTIGWALNHLGHAAQLEGQYEKAVQLHEESLHLFQRIGPQNEGTIWAHQSLGETRLAQGEVSLAAGHFIEALSSCQDLGELASTPWCLAGLAGVAALNEEPERAAWLWGAAEALRKTIGVREGPASRSTHEKLKAQVRNQLGESVFHAKWAEGQAASVQQTIAEAMQ